MQQIETNKQVNHDFEEALKAYAKSLEISETRFDQAKNHYNSIGEWLNREASKLKSLQPRIYTQGSFALGTVIKPINNTEHYDIDLVCELNLNKQSLSQQKLKITVGEELAEYVSGHNLINPLVEGKRCWTINYADSAQFHTDILPAIPELDQSYKQHLISDLNVAEYLAQTAICITDNTKSNYYIVDNNWPHSNPKGYASWFKARMQKQFESKARVVLQKKLNYRSIEEVPVYEVETTLQMAIKILKRHRDIMFKDDPENKPASIIFTTLAAQFYNNEDLLSEALTNIVSQISDLLRQYPIGITVTNPVRPNENFTDRWQVAPKKKANFYGWIEQLEIDLKTTLEQRNLAAMITRLGKSLGDKPMQEILKSLAVPSNLSAPIVEVHRESQPWAF